MSVSRATDCTLQEIGEYAVSSEDIKHKYKSSLDECKTDCVNSPQCRAMYYINRRCFIIHKEAKRVERMGSSYFQKKCHGLYCKYACMVFNKNILTVDQAHLHIFDSFSKTKFFFKIPDFCITHTIL